MSRFLILLCSALVQVSNAAEKNYTIAVIPKGTTHEYWKSVHAGAVKAEQELQKSGTNVKIIWKGPLREDDRRVDESRLDLLTRVQVSFDVVRHLVEDVVQRSGELGRLQHVDVERREQGRVPF